MKEILVLLEKNKNLLTEIGDCDLHEANDLYRNIIDNYIKITDLFLKSYQKVNDDNAFLLTEIKRYIT